MTASENVNLGGIQQANSSPSTISKPPAQPAPKVDSNIRKITAAALEEHRQDFKKENEAVTKELVERGVEKLQKLAEYITDNTHLTARNYQVHEATNRITVTITDSITGEVIKEIPGREFLDRIAKMEQLMGLMFDDFV